MVLLLKMKNKVSKKLIVGGNMFKKGEVLNQTYEIIDEIGQGGSGIVYSAFHLRLQKKVVIKRIKDRYVGKIDGRREVDILKSLHHMYLPQVYDFVQMGTEVYTVIDYIAGNDLAGYVGRALEERQIIQWMRQLGEALEYLHAQNPPIIHSDIKPSNIMITPAGNVCLIDFNISFGEERGSGTIGYSQCYASPEQLYRSKLHSSGGNYRSVLVDKRSDIYSLGASMHHLMAAGKSVYSRQLVSIVKKAMQPEPEDRYQEVSEMLGDILHMKTRDAEYQKLRFGRNLVWGACTFLFIIGVVCMIAGIGERTEEAFLEDYDEIVEKKDYEEDYGVLVEECLGVLNDKRYASTLGKNQDEKADLFYIIANCYFEQVDYENAILFYEYALEADGSNVEYYRDYAIACAREGDVEQAEAILDEALERDMGEDHIHLAQAEIAYARGDTPEAIQHFEQAIAVSDDNVLISRAYILCARVYREQGELKKAAQVLTEATDVVEDVRLPSVLRELGLTCLQYVQGYPDAEDTMEYIKKAIRCYQLLIEGNHGTFHNYMNMAILYQYADDYETCKEVLLEMEQRYPDDYRVYMRLSLLEMVIQSDRAESVRDYTQAKRYYEQAVQLYNPMDGDSDETMQELEIKMQELQGKGW